MSGLFIAVARIRVPGRGASAPASPRQGTRLCLQSLVCYTLHESYKPSVKYGGGKQNELHDNEGSEVFRRVS